MYRAWGCSGCSSLCFLSRLKGFTDTFHLFVCFNCQVCSATRRSKWILIPSSRECCLTSRLMAATAVAVAAVSNLTPKTNSSNYGLCEYPWRSDNCHILSGQGHDRKIATTTEPTENGQQTTRQAAQPDCNQAQLITQATRQRNMAKKGLLQGEAHMIGGNILGKGKHYRHNRSLLS